jgi:hypothetical protein
MYFAFFLLDTPTYMMWTSQAYQYIIVCTDNLTHEF